MRGFQTNKQNKTQNTKMSQLSRKKKIFADCFIAKTCAKFHAVILTPRLNKARRKAKHVHNTLSSFDRFVIFCVGIRPRVDSSCSINRDITRYYSLRPGFAVGEKMRKNIYIPSQPLFLLFHPVFQPFSPTEEPGPRLLPRGGTPL